MNVHVKGKNRMHLKEFTDRLNSLLNSALFKDYAPNGLQIEGKENIQRVGTAVSATYQTLEAAVAADIDVLVVHHGLFWNRDPYPIVGSKKRKIQLLLEREISLLAYHLPLDAHPYLGNNWRAARELGWENLESFGEYEGMRLGVKGNFTPQPIEALITALERYYGHPATTALGGKKSVKTAALISGGAYRELGQAASAGVDCFITGNFDEPAWGVAHEEGIHFLALGHAATERVGPRALAEYIENQWAISAQFLDVSNPF